MLPPDEAAAPRSRSVLRRFSHFQKLYRIVSAACSCICTCSCLHARHPLHRCCGFDTQGVAEWTYHQLCSALEWTSEVPRAT